jgi:hypothetical protein
MKSILLIAVIVSVAGGNVKRYPQEALQCFASSALQSQKDGIIICPQGSNVCVKEFINATRANCGALKGTTHFGRDVWDAKLAQCVYRKCARTCSSVVERLFVGDGHGQGKDVFSRTSSCCETNLCNRADRAFGEFSILVAIICFAANGATFWP